MSDAYESRLADKAEARALTFFTMWRHLPEWIEGDLDNMARKLVHKRETGI